MERQSNGFSLMELMVVIAIITTLVLMTIPAYHLYTRRAHYSEVIQAARPYKLGIEECFTVTNNLSDCRPGSNGIPAAIPTGQGVGLVDAVNVSQAGIITITPHKKYGIEQRDTYVLTPTVYNDRLRWQSSGGGVSEGYAN